MTSQGSAREMHVLGTEECYRLLSTQRIGRLGINAERYPLIFPVNYGLDRGVIVLRMNPGNKLTAADHANVTFEVDGIDERTRSGWSVLIRGLAEKVTEAHGIDLVERTTATGVKPWAPGEHGHWLRLIPHAITGRQIVPGEPPPIFNADAYL